MHRTLPRPFHLPGGRKICRSGLFAKQPFELVRGGRKLIRRQFRLDQVCHLLRLLLRQRDAQRLLDRRSRILAEIFKQLRVIAQLIRQFFLPTPLNPA